jgi:hypothetical protein
MDGYRHHDQRRGFRLAALVSALVFPSSDAALAAEAHMEATGAEPVSLVRLLARDKSLIGKRVRTAGTLLLGDELLELCLTSEDAKVENTLNCVGLDLTDDQLSAVEGHNYKHLLFEGVFSSDVMGSLPLLSDVSEVLRRGGEWPTIIWPSRSGVSGNER